MNTSDTGQRRSPTALLPALVSLLAIGLYGPVYAAQDKKGGDTPTKKTVAMSQPVYEKLQEVQQLVEDKQYEAAYGALAKLRGRKKLSVYERAQIWNLTAYTYYLQERYSDSVDAYEKVMSQGEIPDALVQSTLKTLAQLYFTVEDYPKALDRTQRLMQLVPDPSADVYMLLGQAHYQLKQYREALPAIKKGIDKNRALGIQPKENWLLLLRVIYYELKDYQNVIAVLHELLRLYPKDQYVLTLAAIYSEQGDTHKQLTLTEVLYEKGYLQQHYHVSNLANLYMLHGVPYKAALLLEKEIDDGRLEADERNLRLLSQAWYQAREDAKAIPPLERAAALAKTGELYVRLAQAYTNLEQWDKVAESIRKALDKGGLRRNDTANVMLGVALFNRKQWDSARSAFQKALKDKRSRKVAAQWLSYIDGEERRQELLEQGIPLQKPPAAPDSAPPPTAQG